MSDIADIVELEQLQIELQQQERAILELGHLRRINGLEAIRDGIRRLGELGSPGGVLHRAPRELGVESQFDRIVLSEVKTGILVPSTMWERERERPQVPVVRLTLEYPLVEYEVVRERRGALISVGAAGSRSSRALTQAFGWTSYAVAPILVEGEVVGTLHADACASDRTVDELDCELLTQACTGLGEVFDRAVLRDVLQRQRTAAQAAINMLAASMQAATPSDGFEALGETLTTREREVLALMARGQTNAKIASALAIREGTAKYHVKNVLRKLGARSRADAVARYTRASGSPPK